MKDLGEQTVKNIARPIRAFSVTIKPARLPAAAGASTAPHVPSEKPSIAVLPFNNMSGDPDQDYFIARNSTFAYKASSPDVRRVAEELGVRYVLEG